MRGLEKMNFSLEKSYLLKCKGVLEFQNNDFNKAIQTFNQAIPILESNHDFAWASVVDFYIGKKLYKSSSGRCSCSTI